ncbi:glycosyltransferase 87 family protein [Streptacidiphilus monticola]
MTTVKPFAAALRRELREARPRPTRAAFWAALCSLLLYAVWRHLTYMSMVDMLVYRAEGAAVLHGQDLYAIRVSSWSLPATYPPFAAMLFTPTALLAVPVLRILVTAGNVLLLAVLAYQSCRLVRWPSAGLRPAVVLLAAGFGVWLEPVFNTLRYGQINLLLAVLVLADLQRPDGSRGKGVLIGLAAGIKITPAFFAVYLLLSGRPRAALNAALSCAATVAIGALVLPRASWDFWTANLWDTRRVGKEYIVDNQSLRGAIDRLLHTRTRASACWWPPPSCWCSA